MTPRPSLSIVIPAYCEAANILGTLDNVSAAIASSGVEAEVLVIDDGSTDGTSDIVRAHAGKYPNVTLLVNERNLGFGATYRRGVDAASREAIVMVHGDNAWGAETLGAFFAHLGEADVIIGYTRDMWRSRPVVRTLASKTFTGLVNLISGRRLRYYNGLQIHRAARLKPMRIQSSGYGFQAEVLLKGLRGGATFVEVPMVLVERTEGESKAFRLKNIMDVLKTLVRLARLERGWAAQ